MDITDEQLEELTTDELETLQWRAQDIITRRVEFRGLPTQIRDLTARYIALGGDPADLDAPA